MILKKKHTKYRHYYRKTIDILGGINIKKYKKE